MLCHDAKYADDYRIVIEKKYNPSERSPSLTLKFWCLSSNLPFQELKASCHSIILTSGTLSPLDTFEAQLDVPFEVKVENNHVIDVSRQVWCGAIARCNNIDMDGTYKNQSNLRYQGTYYIFTLNKLYTSQVHLLLSWLDSLGTIIKIVSSLAPGGTLVFFTSYSTRDKLLERIEANGFVNDLHQNNVAICIEPKDNNELKSVINTYLTAISSGRKAIMFCVFKGKISEGISFSDSYCRSVIMVGIPYGNTQDKRSSLKKEFQDTQNRNNPLHINGSKWYSQQAYRAINQAVGRVIRHRLDWGSILLVDQRYCHAEHYGQLSKWLRGNVQIVNNFEDSIIPIKLYYSNLINDAVFNEKSNIDPITIEDEDDPVKVPNQTMTKSSLIFKANKEKAEEAVAKKVKKPTGQIRLTNYFVSKK